ncbi:MAG: hypothetical protein DME83_04150 [Verrucomicrobia bacterium]|nr:MAG: hypothetical protein DME83_04150 [Verrucomicrobiota bacterium]
MLHIYRQITALDRCRPVVIAQKREQAERYPFEPVYVVAKPTTHFLRRFWFRKVRDAPWQISGALAFCIFTSATSLFTSCR